jgi:hypothetical protein
MASDRRPLLLVVFLNPELSIGCGIFCPPVALAPANVSASAYQTQAQRCQGCNLTNVSAGLRD